MLRPPGGRPAYEVPGVARFRVDPLVTGPADSGKSTTLVAMIDLINETKA